MTDDAELTQILEKHRYFDKRGAFFGAIGGRPVGSGILVDNCRVPVLDNTTGKFLTGRGLVCVLTHECDVDPANERLFNEKLLIIPIIDFKTWFRIAKTEIGDELAKQTALDIVADQIYRVFFLPTIPDSEMDYGGILYFNEITNTEISDVNENGRPVCSLSEYSFRILSYKLENHLLRPKSSQLMITH